MRFLYRSFQLNLVGTVREHRPDNVLQPDF